MVSVIIPAYNEERALPDTLHRLFQQQGDYEVIVVDGGSRDKTCDRAQQHPRVRLVRASKGRAKQMNAGARIAGGEWLLFLHADTWLPDGALVSLNRLEADSQCLAGGFRHRFFGDDWRLRLVSALDNFRCARSHIIYGDQALFVRRTLFHRLGGFPDEPILEDVLFGERLNQVTRPRLLDQHVLTDPRKFLALGIWRALSKVFMIIICFELRRPVLGRDFFADIR